MKLQFLGKRIAGIHVVLPRHEQSFVDDMARFGMPESRSLKLKEVMGYDRHRLVEDGVCVSDLAVAGLEQLFETGQLGRDDFDALIVLTQSPDYFMPATSNVIQGRLNLKQDLLCLDIPQGCAAFLVGLIQSFMLLEQPSIRRVVMIAGDVMSRKVCSRDRNSYPLIGDAIGITIIENEPGGSAIHANLKMDGTQREALMIPAGGFRLPSSAETAVEQDAGDNNYRSLDNLRMDGTAVFNFVQREVPPMIDDLLSAANADRESIDYFLFHQPNRFMLEKLAAKMQVPIEKMPCNIVQHYGNASGATIPLNIVHNIGPQLLNGSLRVCFAGFGVGLTWSSMLMTLGPLDFCSMQEV
ncbi:MAG: 3-oxoacyl-ACP synthase III family protein [Planctomyces sp.]|jgi:3-oxoacyl-[acyl-carrier-protein] synthase-3